MPNRFLVHRTVVGGGLLLLAVAAVLLVRGGGEPARERTIGSAGEAPAGAAAGRAAQLPGGGRTIFPARRVVAFYGHPADEELGTLGVGSPAAAGRRLLRQAQDYARPRRRVLPAMELLAVVATFDPGPDGLYRRRTTGAVVQRYLRAARSIGALLVLDIQPGQARFLPEARRLERWLREPDVGLALDPEWHVEPGQVPGEVIGSVEAQDVNAVAAWLDDLTARHQLPQKLLIVHQFTQDMIEGKDALRPHRNVATVLNADGFGSAEVKAAKYRAFTRGAPWTFDGFKLFYREDAGLMGPRQVLRLRPPPDVVVYE